MPDPLVLEAPFYHGGQNNSMVTGTFLEHAGAPLTVIRDLSAEEQANKRRRLACFGSQAETLTQFEICRELFRIAPRYNFSRPPHAGQLFYERFAWGMTGERFCDLASLALSCSNASTRSLPFNPA